MVLQGSGQAMPVGDIKKTVTEWEQVWAEDFNTPVQLGKFPDSVYDKKLTVYKNGWKDTTQHGVYAPAQVLSVHDGCLDYFLHTGDWIDNSGVAHPNTHMVSTVVPWYEGLQPQKGFLYMRYSIRMKTDVMPKYKVVPLLWPDKPQVNKIWSVDGEIDWPEADTDKPVAGYIHLQDATAPNDQVGYHGTVTPSSGWHTYDCIWTAQGIQFKLDGVAVNKYPGPRIPNTPMHLDLQVETSTASGAPDNATQGHVLIDWVTVYKYVGR